MDALQELDIGSKIVPCLFPSVLCGPLHMRTLVFGLGPAYPLDKLMMSHTNSSKYFIILKYKKLCIFLSDFKLDACIDCI